MCILIMWNQGTKEGMGRKIDGQNAQDFTGLLSFQVSFIVALCPD